jgi:glycopeptide antibiotics resistance protein
MAARFRRRLVTVLLVLYAGFVLVVTATPEMPGSSIVRRAVDWLLYALNTRQQAIHFSYLEVEFVGNILMFVPLGIFAALLVARKQWWLLLFMGTAFSIAIELFQARFLPDRVPEVRDVISNSAGFLIGSVISLSFRLIVGYRDSLVDMDRRQAAAR